MDFGAKRALFVDAPLARTPVEAEQGRLNTMVGADEAVFARLKPVLSAFCENVIHAGPPGHGHTLKLINNFIAQAIATATAEALAAAAKSGLSIKKLHEVISAGAVNSGIFWATKDSLTRIGHNGADPGLVTMMLSDVDKRVGVILFVNTAVRQEDGAVYGAIFEDLWKLGVALGGGLTVPPPSR